MILTRRRRRSKVTLFFHLSYPVRLFLRRASFTAFIFFSLILIFIHVSNNPVAQRGRLLVSDIFAPMLAVLSMPIDGSIKTLQSLKEYLYIHEKNKQLTEENRQLKKQLTSLSRVISENYRLYELLKFVEGTGYRYISTRVIGDARGPFVSSALINAGKNDGIKKGQAVINADGVVGRVVETGNNTSRILLLSDINSRIPVITNISRERSIMAGQTHEDPELLYLSSDTRIQEGERVITSGDGGIFPPDLPVGIVYKSKQGFHIKPEVRWSNLEYVSVLQIIEEPIKESGVRNQESGK